jgi:hypothetical protein
MGSSILAFSRGRLATNLPLFPRGFQLPIPLGVDLLLTPVEHVHRRGVADGTIQADVVVMLDLALHQTPRIVQRQWRSGRMHSSLSDWCQRSIFRSIGDSREKF